MEIEAPEDYIKSEVIKKIEFTYTEQEVTKQIFTEEYENDIARTPLKYVDKGDGTEVVPGEVLTYTITYRNEKNVNEKIRIEDKIPEGTIYLKGYATAEIKGKKGEVEGLILKEPEGKKDGEYIVWESDTFEIKPGETIRVTFKVRVKQISEGLEVDKVTNKATISHGENINIYVKKVKYKVKYYKDNIVNGEFLGEEEFEGNLGDVVNFDRIDKNLFKPEDYKDGIIAEESVKELGRGENIIYVVYEKEKQEEPENKKPFITKYYKDSISEENKLGEKEVEGEIGDRIDWDKINKDLFKPEGYEEGEIDEEISATIIEENGENIVYIVYKKKEVKEEKITVKYYKDKIEEGKFLGKDEIEAKVGDIINYDLIDTEKRRVEGYSIGIIIEEISAKVVEEGKENIVYVVYMKLPEKDETNEVESPIKPYSKEINVGENVAVMAGEEVEYTVAYKNTIKV